MPALITRKRGPHRHPRRRRRMPVPRIGALVLQAPPGRPEFDDEGFELIGPGSDRAGDNQ
jgi:hypothetical protein